MRAADESDGAASLAVALVEVPHGTAADEMTETKLKEGER
jgi:hypothetical protein